MGSGRNQNNKRVAASSWGNGGSVFGLPIVSVELQDGSIWDVREGTAKVPKLHTAGEIKDDSQLCTIVDPPGAGLGNRRETGFGGKPVSRANFSGGGNSPQSSAERLRCGAATLLGSWVTESIVACEAAEKAVRTPALYELEVEGLVEVSSDSDEEWEDCFFEPEPMSTGGKLGVLTVVQESPMSFDLGLDSDSLDEWASPEETEGGQVGVLAEEPAIPIAFDPVSCTVHARINGVPLVALVDSGATRSYIKAEVAATLELELGKSVSVELADATHAQGFETTAELCVGTVKEPWAFTVVPLITKGEVILGMDFLTLVNPQIDWHTRTLSFRYKGLLTQTAKLNILSTVEFVEGVGQGQFVQQALERGEELMSGEIFLARLGLVIGELDDMPGLGEMESECGSECSDPPELLDDDGEEEDRFSEDEDPGPAKEEMFYARYAREQSGRPYWGSTVEGEDPGKAQLGYIKELTTQGKPDPNEGPSPCKPWPLDEASKQRLEALCEKHKAVFGKPPPGVPLFTGIKHKINLVEGAKAQFRTTGRMSALELAEIRQQLDKLLLMGRIEPSQSEFSAGVMFARKKDGSLRMCMDYRDLNRVTVPSRYPLPRIDDCLDRIQGAVVFSKLDLTEGYNQIAMEEGDRYKTAFGCRYGQFQWKVMSFGINNAPATFMQAMNMMLEGLVDRFVVVYLDDILVFSRTVDLHFEHLGEVFERLAKHQLFAKREKCEFFLEECDFLGHILKAGGVAMDTRKVAAVVNWPVPSNVAEVRQILGLVGYYRRFLAQFAEVTEPLTRLLSPEVQWQWGKLQQGAFEKVKQLISSSPVLVIPDPSKPFEVHCDASGFAVGAALMQDQGQGLQPCCFYSKKLQKEQLNWPVHIKEGYAVFKAFETWRCYLHGCQSKITVYTDHESVKYLRTQKHLDPKQVRWAMFLEEFPDFEIVYLPGKYNVVPDALSRRPDLKD